MNIENHDTTNNYLGTSPGGYIVFFLEKNPEGSATPFTTKSRFLRADLKEKFESHFKGKDYTKLSGEEIDNFLNDNI